MLDQRANRRAELPMAAGRLCRTGVGILATSVRPALADLAFARQLIVTSFAVQRSATAQQAFNVLLRVETATGLAVWLLKPKQRPST